MPQRTKEELQIAVENLRFSYVGGTDETKVKSLLNDIIDSFPDSAVNYSTSEQALGIKWPDDKDVFRLVIPVEPGLAANLAFNLTAWNIDTMIKMDVLLVDVNGGYAHENNNVNLSSLQYGIYWDKGGSQKQLNIIFNEESLGAELVGGHIIIEYTKN